MAVITFIFNRNKSMLKILWNGRKRSVDSVAAKIREHKIYVEADHRAEKLGYKIRDARLARVPYILVVGEKEQETGAVSVRSRFLGDEGQKPLEQFINDICEEIRTKAIRKIEVTE